MSPDDYQWVSGEYSGYDETPVEELLARAAEIDGRAVLDRWAQRNLEVYGPELSAKTWFCWWD